MIKYSFLFAAVLFVSASINVNYIYAQAPDCAWAKSAGGNDDDNAYSVTTDASGNIIVVGYFSSPTITFGSTTLTNTSSSFDMFIVKYDPSGNVLWAKSAGGNDTDWASSITTDASGNIIVVGVFSSPITFGSTTLTSPTTSFDMFIVKYDTDGNVLWAKSAGGNSLNLATYVDVDASGNILISGYFFSGTGTIIFGNTTLTGTSLSDDIFIVKYDANGNVLWAKSAGGGFSDEAYSVVIDANENIFITGDFNSPSIVFGNTILFNTDNTGNTSDVFIAKYDKNGNVLWAKSVGGGNGDGANSVTADASGNIIVAGYFDSPTITFGAISCVNAINTGNISDIFIAKYDGSGNPIWAKSAGGSDWDAAYSVTADASGNILITGVYFSSSITLGSVTLTNAGNDDMFLVEYDTSGNVLWAKSTGGAYEDYGSSVTTDINKNIVVAGVFSDFTITFDSITLTNTHAGYRDVFITKYDNGNITEVSDEKNEELFSIYPNPSRGIFNIQPSKLTETANLKIYTALGDEIYSSLINDYRAPISIDLSQQPNGIYLIIAKTEEGVMNKKIIIQK